MRGSLLKRRATYMLVLCMSLGHGRLAAQDDLGQRLEALAEAQQRALAGGDGAQVLATSRALGAYVALALGNVAAGDGKTSQAEAWYQGALDLEESEAARLALVTLQARGGQGDSGAEEAVRAEGDSARLRLELGAAMHRAGDVNGTIRQLQRAVLLEPASVGAHLALGSAFWELCFFQYNPDSLREFDAAVRLAPESALANFNLGSVLSQYQRYGESKGYLEKAAAMDATSPDAVLQLGMDSWAQNQTEEARKDLQEAVQRTGVGVERNNFQIRRALALLSRIDAAAGRVEQANQEAAAADEMRRRIGASEQVGAVTESVGMVTMVSPAVPVGGAASATAGAAASPVEAKLRRLLAQTLNDAGTALARQRDYAAALPLFRQAVSADDALPGAERNLGLAAFHVGAWREAERALARAVAEQPSDSLAARDLEEVKQHLAEAVGSNP